MKTQQFCNYDPDILLFRKVDNKEKITTLTEKRYIEIKDTYLLMFLHINDNFDDDLLMDAIDILKAQ